MAGEVEFRNWLETEGNIHFKEALKLSKDESKYDPETEPYKSKYSAREILLNIKNKLNSFHVDESQELRLKSLQSVIDYELGLNYIETDEVSTGERYINSITEEFEEVKLTPEFCIVMIKCLQQLGMLWNERGDFEKSLSYFSKAERLYIEYKAVSEVAPFDNNTLFASGEESQVNDDFESLHTHTFYYLTQAYKNNGQNNKSAEYGHKTLQRQLSTNQNDPVDWAVNCATLSQYHLTHEDFMSARHCLAASSCVIEECVDDETVKDLKTMRDLENEGEDERRQRDRVPESKANVALCWSKYCLNLLKLSAEIDDEESKDLPKETNNILQFAGLDVSKIESEISFEIANNFDEARALFLAGQKHLNTAKQFYQLDGYVVNYVEIIQDQSQLFRYLTAFETNLERQCKMSKRRIDMLTELLVQLNPQHYLLICRQLTYEIASIYGDMADLKMEIIKTFHHDKPSLHQIKKINSLLKNSAKFFTHFIDSLKQEGKLPEKFDESVLRVALLAHMYLARAHAKQICATREERLGNQQKALELYQFVVNYCDHDEDGARAFKDELSACREMVDLLPFRLDQIGQNKE